VEGGGFCRVVGGVSSDPDFMVQSAEKHCLALGEPGPWS
jgi:hypothetical protein